MPLSKLAIKPGISADGTRYTSVGTWVDGDKVRFRRGLPESIGGWQKINSRNPFVGVCRSLNPWMDLSGNSLLGVGTHLKFYIERGGSLYDITPIRSTASLTDPFTTTAGSATVVVTHNAHGAVPNDYVTFSGASAVGGLTIDGEYQIASVIDGNSYRITAASTASSSATGGGTVSASYQINTGLPDTVYMNGWGAGTWGGIVFGGTDTGWGDPANVTVGGSQLRLWTADNFGQDLIFNPRDAGIYYWTAGGGLGTRGVALSSLSGADSVPTVAREIMVTDKDRRLVAFGCTNRLTNTTDLLLIRWSDTEFPQMMYPSDDNSAGSLRIPYGSEFITALETKAEILVWSDAALHSLRYIGAPYIYGITPVGMTSIIAPNAKASALDLAFWMGDEGFYRYDGRITPLSCAVHDYVFNDIDHDQAQKIFAVSNRDYNEVWWFYPSMSGGTGEIDRYVGYNYSEDLWFIGSLVRTAWIDRGIEDYPRAAGDDGYLYYQESGLEDGSVDPSVAINSFIESGPVEIGIGDKFGFISSMIPDVSFRNSTTTYGDPTVTLTLKAQDFPGEDFVQTVGDDVSRTTTIPLEQFTTQVYPRLRGRSLTFRLDCTARGVSWRLGYPRIQVREDGRR